MGAAETIYGTAVAAYVLGALIALPLEYRALQRGAEAGEPPPGCVAAPVLAGLWPLWTALWALSKVCGRKS